MLTLKCRFWAPLMLVLGVAVLFPGRAAAEFRFQDGMWRFEIAAGTSYHSGNRSRSGDIQVMGEIEYEIPAADRCTVGLRLIPLFVYDQSDEGEDSVWGGGVGVSTRYYQVPKEYRGWFGELEGAVLGHSGQIDGNSSSFNFMIGAGVGYEFKNHMHTTLKVRHLSNAGLGEDNSGANSVDLALGYRF